MEETAQLIFDYQFCFLLSAAAASGEMGHKCDRSLTGNLIVTPSSADIITTVIYQAIRMDPGYYVLNVAARHSHQRRLISYPYISKAASEGEHTLFLHLDINIDKYFSDQGLSYDQLTSSVSLDKKDT